MQLQLDDTRRLTGPNLFWDVPGAIIDVLFHGIRPQTVVDCWLRQVRSYLDAVGWTSEQCTHRRYDGGASLVISAPIDALYAATELNEAAWHDTMAELTGSKPHRFTEQVSHLKSLIADEVNPSLLRLHAAAVRHGVRFLVDDDEVSIGYGASCLKWPVDRIPSPSSINFDAVKSIPLVLVTGTNGKSTTVRLAASVTSAAGLSTGITSTDYIRVGDDILDTGDYSGPGGARTLLRHPKTHVALLEVARGGILRRGLGVIEADAAMVTNVAADHLGDYGINTVAELIDAKMVVRRALRPNQPLILNADDTGIVSFAREQLAHQRIIYFAESRDNEVLASHIANGGEGVTLIKDSITICHGEATTDVVPVADIPITLGGAARHNVQNALGVTALTHAIGIEAPSIREGLKAFSGDADANPGRGNLYRVNDIQILVDFAHNEHGMQAVADTVASMPAQRRLLLMGQAGDRDNDAIGDLVRAACSSQPDHMVICELPGYERGREVGETSALIRRFANECGIGDEAISMANDNVDGVRQALEWARPGDLLLLFVLNKRDESTAVIDQYIARHEGAGE